MGLLADDPGAGRRLLAALCARPDVAPQAVDGPVQVLVTAAATVDRALALCRHHDANRPDRPVLLVADVFDPAAVRTAVDAGVRTMLRRSDASPRSLVTALGAALNGEARLPSEAVVRLLGASAGPSVSSRLTARQVDVLALMAEGHGNAAIARRLGCSEHTVKNAGYELMARLQARNRAQAVARAVRTGLV
ncbi:DNA-binding response regulator, NarL/FixJ family, contains REC and HTH domains [Micromonospora echinospora]|uniref:DNA-binding response regulator, NarL/FixJ family, contains REC and HTH domains n=1 Tax=Micromonospora echinospora TaxID=1877 RepID=A0A1C4ZA16_MICEC|nr:DNA-binding response regulator, NarL/FixJ family, contains REC and HTH domains [Micromonospora echinospora]